MEYLRSKAKEKEKEAQREQRVRELVAEEVCKLSERVYSLEQQAATHRAPIALRVASFLFPSIGRSSAPHGTAESTERGSLS